MRRGDCNTTTCGLTHPDTLNVFLLQLVQTLQGDKGPQLLPLHLSHQLRLSHHLWAAMGGKNTHLSRSSLQESEEDSVSFQGKRRRDGVEGRRLCHKDPTTFL